MNEAQETYLSNYNAVDKINQMLLGWDFDLQVMEVVACTHQTCESNCNEYGIFFVPLVFQRYGSRMEGHSCIRNKVLAEDVSSDGTVHILKLTVSRG
jgi:hypothetical protein